MTYSPLGSAVQQSTTLAKRPRVAAHTRTTYRAPNPALPAGSHLTAQYPTHAHLPGSKPAFHLPGLAAAATAAGGRRTPLAFTWPIGRRLLRMVALEEAAMGRDIQQYNLYSCRPRVAVFPDVAQRRCVVLLSSVLWAAGVSGGACSGWWGHAWSGALSAAGAGPR